MLNAWDRIQEIEKRTELYTRFKQGQRDLFSDFLQRLPKAIHKGVPDPEDRQVVMKFLAFENSNIECKKILMPLKVRSVPMDECILYTMKVETFDYNTEAWVEEAICNGIRRHHNTKCFNCE